MKQAEKKANKKLDLRAKTFLLLTLAGIINAFGVTMFLAPVHLFDSGISGTSMLLGQITPEVLSLSFFLLVLNLPIFLYGLKKQGLEFTIYSIYAVVVYSLAAFMITDIFPVDVSTASPFAANDLLLCAVFGGGGHAQAAGCTIHAPLQEALDQMLAAMKDKLDKTPRPEGRV